MFKDLIVFSILIVVMLVRPTGLLGKATIMEVERRIDGNA